ncbi:hypothetical protein CPB86DRAFT_773463 [Serendipita vermifera]|nr:hypothetical protein CPB86DRAFT_773463 [Serendipita vermifera]
MPLPAGVNIPLTYSHLLEIFHAARVIRCVNYATFTFMVYDMMLTFAEEIKYIWQARWSVIKVVFLLNRYIAPIIIIGNLYAASGTASGLSDSDVWSDIFSRCQRWVLVSATFEQIALALVALIVILRLHAIWQASRRTLYILIVVWMSGSITSIGMLYNTFYAHKRFIYYEDRLNVCYALVPDMWMLLIPDVILHAALVCFLIFKAIATPRSSQTRMLAVLYYDGVLYYTITFVSMLVALITWRAVDHVWMALPLYSVWMILQVAMSRLLLSLKSTQLVHTSKDHSHSDTTRYHNRRNANDLEMTENPSSPDSSTVVRPPSAFNTTSAKKVQFPRSAARSSKDDTPISFMEMESGARRGWRPTSIRVGSRHGFSGRDRVMASGNSDRGSMMSESRGNWWWWLIPQRRRDFGRSSISTTDEDHEEEERKDPYDYMRGHEKYLSWL